MTHTNKVLEWGGAILSIAYSLLIASNSGFEVLSFVFFRHAISSRRKMPNVVDTTNLETTDQALS